MMVYVNRENVLQAIYEVEEYAKEKNCSIEEVLELLKTSVFDELPCLMEEDARDEMIKSMYTLNEYQVDAARTINEELTSGEKLVHAVFGMSGENGEISSIFQKKYQGHPIDTEHLIKEIGDLMWFVAEAATAIGVELSEIARKNIAKLKVRYPNKFTCDRSVNREKYGTTDEQMEAK